MISRNIAALLAVANLEIARTVIEARKRAEYEAARASILSGQVGELWVGQTIDIDGKAYRITGLGPGPLERLIERLTPPELAVEPERAARKFGSDRPYLKKKKGRS